VCGIVEPEEVGQLTGVGRSKLEVVFIQMVKCQVCQGVGYFGVVSHNLLPQGLRFGT